MAHLEELTAQITAYSHLVCNGSFYGGVNSIDYNYFAILLYVMVLSRILDKEVMVH